MSSTNFTILLELQGVIQSRVECVQQKTPHATLWSSDIKGNGSKHTAAHSDDLGSASEKVLYPTKELSVYLQVSQPSELWNCVTENSQFDN